MASSANRRRIEIPVALHEALEVVAKREDMPTNALAALWLWEQLELKARVPGSPAEGVHAPQPYRMDGPQMYPRRDPLKVLEGLPKSEDVIAIAKRFSESMEATQRMFEQVDIVKLVLAPRSSDDHSQQTYAAKLEEHAAWVDNERGETQG